MLKYLLRFFCIFVLSLILLPVGGLADNSKDIYRQAHQLLHDGRYVEAHRAFNRLIGAELETLKTPDYLFYKAKAGYYAGFQSESKEDLNYLISHFSKSSFVSYSHYYLGNIHYKQGNASQAVKAYINSYKISTDKKLDDLIIKSLEAIISVSSSTVLEHLAPYSIPADKRCKLLIPLAQALVTASTFQPIKSLLAGCEDDKAIELAEHAEQLLGLDVEIGIVLPLSGELQKYGESLLDGITLMAERYIRETKLKLKPVVYDTRGDNFEAARVVRRISSSGAAAAIGPLTSDEAAVASAVLSCGDLPLIVPAASQAGLTELSSTSFQLQANLEWQGIKMADFALYKLGADTAAIITPTSPENLRMARAFANRFKAIGGTILGIEYFRTSETDFGPYVRDIKSLIVGELLDSLVFLDEDGDTVEAEAVPVWLDCLYIPANAGQLRMLLPQVDFYNLNTAYLGGDGWGTSKVYRFGNNITKTCYFTSGRIESPSNEIGQQFMAEFDRKYGRQPDHLAALGYDAMALICEALKAGWFSRNEISRYISSINKFQGASGVITFGENRENIELPIYTIDDGIPEIADFSDKQDMGEESSESE